MSKYDVDETVVSLSMGTSSDPTIFTPDDGSDTVDSDDDDDDENNEGGGVLEDKVTSRKHSMMTARPFGFNFPSAAGKNPDALPPTTAFGRFFLKLGSILKFFKSPEGIFALRHALVSVALWIPSVCPSSAFFYYENKGIWALIMAQVRKILYTMRVSQCLLILFVDWLGRICGRSGPYLSPYFSSYF